MIDDFAAIFPFGFPLEKAIHCRCAIRYQITVNSLFDRCSHGFCNALIRCETANKKRLNIVIFDYLFQIASHKSIKGVTTRDKSVALFEQSLHDLRFPGAFGKYFPES